MTESRSRTKPDSPRIVTASSYDRLTGLDIRIDRIGRGEPIVFLNGLLGLNEHWFNCIGPLINRAECLLIQPPLLKMKGGGCSIQGLLRLTISMLETITDKPAVMVGNSLGGHISLRVALSRPDLVRGVILIGSSGLFEKSFEKGVQREPTYEWLDRKIRDLFYDTSCMSPKLVDRAYEELVNRDAARAFVRLGRSAKRDSLAEELDQVSTPTMVLWGRQDTVTPPEVAEQFASRIPNARLRWIDKCGHAPQLERPGELARGIGEFLDELGFAGTNSAGSRAEDVQEVA